MVPVMVISTVMVGMIVRTVEGIRMVITYIL